ncbi:MAG: aldo/keto reductase [Phycisphaerales bacterium]|nr:aldo/keto reductase [Phycisphaerales bacterium]
MGGQWGDLDQDTAICTVKAALDAGVTFFDTADAYGLELGTSEMLLGRALRGSGDNVRIASKVGNWGRRLGIPMEITHPLHIQPFCDATLYRLGRDTVDVYFCHLGGQTQADIWIEGFERLVKQGKVRTWGVSTDRLDVLEAFNRNGQCGAVQLDYSLVNRSAEAKLLPYCLQHQIAVVVRGPLGMGLCSGRYTPESTFNDQVRQKWNEGPGHEKMSQRLSVVERLRQLANRRTMAQAALQFVISHPAVTVPIPGAKSIEQATDNAAAGSLGPMDEAELAWVREVTG